LQNRKKRLFLYAKIGFEMAFSFFKVSNCKIFNVNTIFLRMDVVIRWIFSNFATKTELL